MRPVIKVAVGFALLIAIGVVAAVVFLSRVDFSRYKEVVVEAVHSATGRELSIAGQIRLELGFSPALAVDDITLANAEWGSRPEMLKIGRVEVQVELIPLFSRRVVVKRLVLVEPDVLLETDGAGAGNWILSGKEKSGGTLPEFNRVAVRNGVLRYRDGKSGKVTIFALDRMETGTDGSEHPVHLELTGSLDNAPVTARATIASLPAFFSGGRSALSFEATLAGLEISAEGMVSGGAGEAEKGVDLAVRLHGQDVALPLSLAGARGQKGIPYRLEGRLAATAGNFTFKDIKAKAGKSDLSGSLAVKTTGERMMVSADLFSQLIDLEEIFPKEKGAGSAAAGKAPSAGGRLFPERPLPLAGLAKMDAMLKLRVERVAFRGIALEKAATQLSISNGRLAVQPFRLKAGKGTVQGNLSLESVAQLPKARVSVQAAGLDADHLLAFFGKKDVVGGVPLSLSLEVAGRGHSIRAIMAGLDGRLLIQAGAGRINNRYLDIAGADTFSQLLAVLNPAAAKRDYSALECAVVNFTVNNGIATTNRGIAAKTSMMTLVGSGGINLKTEELDIGFKPAARGGIGINLGQLAGAVRLGGTLAKPAIMVDPVGAAKTAATVGGAIATGGISLLAGMLFDRATVDEEPCLTAMGKRPATSPAPAREGREKGIGDMLKGLFGR